MLIKLSEKLKIPKWARLKSERYMRLTILDRLLDGTFYDDLPAAFYDERDEQGTYIKLEDRRPCVQFNLPMYVAKTTARKLFAGNHCPKLMHDKPEIVEKLKTLANSSNLFYFMLQAAIWAAVGSVCVTFKIIEEKFLIEIWRARFCWPQFAMDGQLEKLRIAYVTTNLPPGTDAEGEDIKLDGHYWFIRDLDGIAETNYLPIKEDRWNPVEGPMERLKADKEESGIDVHKLGFIPAVWGINLAGGEMPDGASTFAPAISMSIDIDYTMSQIGRGVRYNAAPTTMIKGDIQNESGEYDRSEMVIHLKSGIKDSSGMTIGEGDAKLLEMSGGAVDASLKYVAFLRKLALETCAAARKDPTTTKGPLSGKAVEALDDQFIDLVQELRTSMGDTFMLTLVKKMLLAGLKVGHSLCQGITESDIQSIGVVWKRALPTPPEALVQVASALQTLLDAGLIEKDMAQRFTHMTLDLDALEAQETVTNVMTSGARPEPTPDEVSTPKPGSVKGAASGGNLSSKRIDGPLDSTPHA